MTADKTTRTLRLAAKLIHENQITCTSAQVALWLEKSGVSRAEAIAAVQLVASCGEAELQDLLGPYWQDAGALA